MVSKAWPGPLGQCAKRIISVPVDLIHDGAVRVVQTTKVFIAIDPMYYSYGDHCVPFPATMVKKRSLLYQHEFGNGTGCRPGCKGLHQHCCTRAAASFVSNYGWITYNRSYEPRRQKIVKLNSKDRDRDRYISSSFCRS